MAPAAAGVVAVPHRLGACCKSMSTTLGRSSRHLLPSSVRVHNAHPLPPPWSSALILPRLLLRSRLILGRLLPGFPILLPAGPDQAPRLPRLLLGASLLAPGRLHAGRQHVTRKENHEPANALPPQLAKVVYPQSPCLTRHG